MNNKIAKILKTYLEELTWADKIAGLTQVLIVHQNEVEKRMPISCDISYDNCLKGCYDELVPNSNYRSMLYFEDGTFTLSKSEGKKKYYESTLRLIGWLNYSKLNGGCGATGDYIIDIIKIFPAYPLTIDSMYAFNVEVASQLARSNNIFSKYTYNEFQTQYLMLPYDYFALDLRVSFYIIGECIEPEGGGCLEC